MKLILVRADTFEGVLRNRVRRNLTYSGIANALDRVFLQVGHSAFITTCDNRTRQKNETDEFLTIWRFNEARFGLPAFAESWARTGAQGNFMLVPEGFMSKPDNFPETKKQLAEFQSKYPGLVVFDDIEKCCRHLARLL